MRRKNIQKKQIGTRMGDRLDDMLRHVEGTPADTFPFPAGLLDGQRIPEGNAIPAKQPSGHFRWVVPIAATLAAVLLLGAIGLPLMLTQGGPGIVTTPESDAETVPAPIDPAFSTPPWEDGGLRLITMTYKYGSPADGGEETATPSDGTPVENLTVSLVSDTKISSYADGDLLRLAYVEGEHRDCDGVFYDIREDRLFCLSCTVLDMIRSTDLYGDACVRCAIEECLWSTSQMISGGLDTDWYARVYRCLWEEAVRQTLADGEYKQAAKALQRIGEETGDLAKYQPPAVKVVEYGRDRNICLFTLSSARAAGVWGAYVIYLDTGECRRIDGDTVGIPAYTGTLYASESLSVCSDADLSQAFELSFNDDYTRVVATVPYFGSELRRCFAIEGYVGDFYRLEQSANVFVYDLADGSWYSLLSWEDSGRTEIHPAGSAALDGDIIYWKTNRGSWYFRQGSEQDTYGFSYELSGGFLRLIRSRTGTTYAVMQEGEIFAIYALSEGEARMCHFTAEAFEEQFDVANRYVVEDGVRTDLADGSQMTLWEGDCTVTVSEDGRYAYLYVAGAREILCVDIFMNIRGRLALSEDFVTQAAQAGDVNYLLFLNADGDRLLMTYYRPGTMTFDYDSYDRGHIPRDEYWDVRGFLPCYLINGEPVTFRDEDTICLMLVMLTAQARLDADVQGANAQGQQEAMAEAAQRLIHYLEYSGQTAWVSKDTVQSFLNGQSKASVIEMYRYQKSWLRATQYTGYSNRPLDNLATKISEDILRYVWGYHMPPVSMGMTAEERARTKAYYAELNKGLDAEQMKAYQTILKAALSEHLAKFAVEVEGMTEKTYPLRFTGYELMMEVYDLLPSLVEMISDQSCTEFVQSGAWMTHAYGQVDCYTRVSGPAGTLLFGMDRFFDREAMTELLTSVTFTPGKVPGPWTREAMVAWNQGLTGREPDYRTDFPLIVAGHSEQGQAYIQIPGAYAAVSQEVFDHFLRLCSEGEAFDETVMDDVWRDTFPWLREEENG